MTKGGKLTSILLNQGFLLMSSIRIANASSSSLPGALVFLLAAGAGLSVASLYYAQPLLAVLADDMHAATRTAGFLPTLTQLGYALGIVLFAPLGDRYDRRRIILGKAAVLCAGLLVMAMAPSMAVLLAASLLVGMAATMAQDLVPAAAVLAPAASRGRVVGTVMTGLLLGILLSRVMSGFVAEHSGWRGVFLAAAVAMALVTVALQRGLPRFAPTTTLPYLALLGSLKQLWQKHPALRRATLSQGLLSVGFSAFWSTLAVMLHGAPFHLGSSAAGAFGLAGAAGALIAPVAGKLADRHGPARVVRVGAIVVVVSFAFMGLAPLMGTHAQLALLVVCTIGFDLGIQAALIGHQSIVFGLDPAARSRLNAVLLVGMFLAMAVGSAVGGLLLDSFGWPAVIALACVTSALALVLRKA